MSTRLPTAMSGAISREPEFQNASLGYITTTAAMAVGLIHDMSQPLSAATTFMHAARKLLDAGCPDQSVLSGTVERAERELRRAREMLARLRNVASAVRTERLPVHLLELTRTIAEQVSDVAHERAVRMRVEPASLPYFGGNAGSSFDFRSSGQRAMATRRSVYVIDDDPAMRESLALLLETAGVHGRVFATAEAFLASLKDKEPICALVDVFLPGMNGLSLQQQLADRGIEAALIFMAGQADVPMAVHAMRAGAANFIEKPFDPDDLLEAIDDAVGRQDELRQRHAKRDEAERVLNTLTARERQVLALLIEGHPNKVVGARLGISTRTAEHHRSHIMAKMKARTLPHLVRMSAEIMDLAQNRIGRTADSHSRA